MRLHVQNTIKIVIQKIVEHEPSHDSFINIVKTITNAHTNLCVRTALSEVCFVKINQLTLSTDIIILITVM